MKYIFLNTLLLIAFSGWSQQDATLKVKVSGEIYNLPSDTIFISRNKGNSVVDIFQGVVKKNGKFSFKVDFPGKDYYLLRLSDNQTVNLIVQDEEELKIYGDGKDIFQHSNVVGSEASTALNEFMRYYSQYNAKLDSAKNYLKQNPGEEKQVNASFKPIYDDFVQSRQQFIDEQINSPALIGVLGAINLQQEFELYEKVVQSLDKSFGESLTVQKLSKELDKNRKIIAANKPFSPGSEVEDIVMENPDGEVMKLSDYKGKVVLVDFWASWCGPCRKENPTVVKLYEKYKKDGFEVFSVSLDKNQERWVAAIEKDNLSWDAHVSDLNGWQNAAAKKYNVSSIPFTVLLDREGKVINTKLRGFQLEQTLESIFGY